MKYCISNKSNQYINEVDEILVEQHKVADFRAVTDFITEHPNIRVVFKVVNLEILRENKWDEIIFAVAEANPNLKFSFVFYYDELSNEYAEKLQSKSISYFFNEYVYTWGDLHLFMNKGVSDIKVGGDLCFQLDLVSVLLHSVNINVRCVPNLVQNGIYNTPMNENSSIFDITSFFIRPEDVELYEDIIDVFDISCPFPIREEVVYKAYAIDKKWFGRLNEIIIGLDSSVNNIFLSNLDFSKRRIHCEHKCLKGNPCRRCYALEGLAKELEEQELRVVKKN